MTILNQVTAAQPIRDGHQGGINSGNVNPLFHDEYTGEVDHSFQKGSIMRQFFKFRSVRGTDTITKDRIGQTSLQKVARGIRPTDAAPTFDNISVKVDTMVLARSVQATLDDFLQHIDVRKEVGVEHGKTIAKFFDESFLVQGIKAAQVAIKAPGATKAIDGCEGITGLTSIVRSAPEGFRGGSVVELAAANDEVNPDKLVTAILNLCQKVEEKDVEIAEATLLVRPAQYYALLQSDKLVDKNFSDGNGNFAEGRVLKVNGIRIMTTNRFPAAANTGSNHHYLSNAGNGYAYDVTAQDMKAVAVLLMPKALLAGETIPLTTKIHYSDVELQWFIDAYLAYGVTPDRAEHAGVIFKK